MHTKYVLFLFMRLLERRESEKENECGYPCIYMQGCSFLQQETGETEEKRDVYVHHVYAASAYSMCV